MERSKPKTGALINRHLAEKNSPCFVVTAPGVVPRVQSDINMRVPDLAVTCSPGLPGDRALRDPVLIIEILSPSNRAETWMNVWSYTTIPSVREILVLHSDKIGAELLRRGADGMLAGASVGCRGRRSDARQHRLCWSDRRVLP